jgi:molybdopterin molybdotransferase
MRDMLGRGEAVSVEDALRIIRESLPPKVPKSVSSPIEESYGMVLSKAVVSPEDLPAFPRSTMDGYAVLSGDTFGASEGSPAYLNVLYEVRMGEVPGFDLKAGEAARIATGGMLPGGADAVLMLEHAQMADEKMLEAQRAVAPGENVIQMGEDIRTGAKVCERGRRLRAEDVAVFAGLGITGVSVYEKPKVSIISTGDEVVPPGTQLKPGMVRDMNSYILAGLVLDEGGVPLRRGIVKDEFGLIQNELRRSVEESDMVLITGGSSVGTRDMTDKVVAGLGRVLFHSVSLKPGKPTLAGVVGDVPVFGLPGHPRAVSVSFDVFIRPVLGRLSGLEGDGLKELGASVRARLSKSVHSASGRQDRIPVLIEERDGELWAEPLLGKSGLLSTLVRANGVLAVPHKKLGFDRGEVVEITLR